MDIRQLEFFLEVVDSGSITAAARNRHIAQPSLSQSLRRLEREVGTPLFERVGRGMHITSAGEALIGPAKRILREREDAHAAVAAVAGLAGGRLIIASLPSLTLDPLAAMIGRFRATYPQVKVQIRKLVQADEIVEAVEHGACDLGALGAPVHVAGLTTHNVGIQRLVLLAPQNYPLPDSTVDLHALAEMPFVCGPPGGSSRKALEDILHTVGAHPNIVVETESTEAIVPLVVHGNGVALVPEGLAAAAPRPGIQVRTTEAAITRTTVMLHRQSMASPSANAFLTTALP